MTYIKLFLTAGLMLLITHCGQKDEADVDDQKALGEEVVELSSALKKADCLSGVYTTTADIDSSFWGSFSDDPLIQISIAHNSNNEDSKIIVLLEKIDEMNTEAPTSDQTEGEVPPTAEAPTSDQKEGETAPSTPAAACSILSDIEHNNTFNLPSLVGQMIEHRGTLVSVIGIKNSIRFQEASNDQELPDNSEDLACGSLYFMSLLDEDEDMQEKLFNFNKQEDKIVNYEELEQKCMALKFNISRKSTTTGVAKTDTENVDNTSKDVTDSTDVNETNDSKTESS